MFLYINKDSIAHCGIIYCDEEGQLRQVDHGPGEGHPLFGTFDPPTGLPGIPVELESLDCELFGFGIPGPDDERLFLPQGPYSVVSNNCRHHVLGVVEALGGGPELEHIRELVRCLLKEDEERERAAKLGFSLYLFCTGKGIPAAYDRALLDDPEWEYAADFRAFASTMKRKRH